MPEEEKPYRLYKGGRAKGKVPSPARPSQGSADGRRGGRGGVKARRPRWGRRIGVTLLLLVLVVAAWGVASYLSFREGVTDANARLPKAVESGLARQEGPLLSKPTLLLLLGTDGDRTAARSDASRSDSILVVRTDPSRHRLAFLSIPRDLRVEIPGHGANKINAAFQLGGPALAMETIAALTGLEANHVMLVDFDDFRTVIDALGGIDVTVPKPILSNRFDCPYATEARCQQWEGWRFEKGEQHMSGKRALIYSRIRENRLDPAENDLTRGERQQEVVQAMGAKLTSVTTFARLPFVGGDLVAPLTTDLSAPELAQLGWVYKRANRSRALHCRLGGELASVGGQSVILGDQENFGVIAMFRGNSAPQPPPPGQSLAAGCLVGSSSDD
ncbi:MAG: LCP family protein [Gaiellaceae bacterium MAG52_C11]|nr:LCP family protein [Candidatus Gaiellasilicea maunaloa]